jgi:hypothetical protein
MRMLMKSKHVNYIRIIDDRCLLLRPIDDNATKYDILNYQRYEYNSAVVNELISSIQDKFHSDLLSNDITNKYPNDHPRWNRKYFGFCVPATFALLFLIDTKNLHPYQGHDQEKEYHWWLQDTTTGDRIDATAQQYSDKELQGVYATGKPTGLYYAMKERPQKRFLDLMQLVQPTAKRYITRSIDDLNPPPEMNDFL